MGGAVSQGPPKYEQRGKGKSPRGKRTTTGNGTKGANVRRLGAHRVKAGLGELLHLGEWNSG